MTRFLSLLLYGNVPCGSCIQHTRVSPACELALAAQLNDGTRLGILYSAYYHQCNGPAEFVVKTIKRILMGKTGSDNNLDNDTFARVIVEYRNTST